MTTTQIGASFEYDFTRRSQPNSDEFNRRWGDIDRRLNQVESFMPSWEAAVQGLSNETVARIDEVITPIAQTLEQTAELGFLTAFSSDTQTLHVGDTILFSLTQNAALTSYLPSTFVIVERQSTPADYAICQRLQYDKEGKTLAVLVLSVTGNGGPHNDWQITNSPGVSLATRATLAAVQALQRDVQVRQTDVAARQQDVTTKRNDAIAANTAAQSWANSAAASAVAAAVFDPTTYPKLNGSKPFTGVQAGVSPSAGENGNSFTTTAWVRQLYTSLVNGAPAALDTLKELADALGDDPNFSSTVLTGLANRLRCDIASSWTAAQGAQARNNLGGSAVSRIVAPTAIDPLYGLAQEFEFMGAFSVSAPASSAVFDGWSTGVFHNRGAGSIATANFVGTISAPNGAFLDGVLNGTKTVAYGQKGYLYWDALAAPNPTWRWVWLDRSPLLLSINALAGTAYVDFNMPAGYSAFACDLFNVVPSASGANFGYRLSANGGTTIRQSSSDYHYGILNGASTSSGSSAGTDTLSWIATALNSNVQAGGSSHPMGAVGRIEATYGSSLWTFGGVDSSGVIREGIITSSQVTTDPIIVPNLARFLMSSGTFAAQGTIKGIPAS